MSSQTLAVWHLETDTDSLGQTGLNILIMVQKIDTHTVNNQQSSHTFALALESRLLTVLTVLTVGTTVTRVDES